MRLPYIPGISTLRLLRWLAGAAALYYIAVFAGLALLRMFYPYELEWTEGAMLDQIYWIQLGRWEYGPPTLNFIPICYNPLYLYTAALFSKVLGLGFLAPRLLSVLSTLGILGFLYALVSENTGRRSAGLLAAGVFAATFRFSGAWLDLAKVDSLFLLLLLAAHWVGRRQIWRAWIISGLLYVLAYYTKQLALPLILVMAAASLIQFRGRTWPQWAAAAAAGGLVFVWLEASSGGWYSFYTIRALSYHERIPALWSFWRQFLGAAWPGLLAAAVTAGFAALFYWQRRRPPEFKPLFWQDLLFALALIAISWSVFFKIWTYDNGFIPACAGLALLSGWAFGFTLRWADQPDSPSQARWLHLSAAILLLAQFANLVYSPFQQLPSTRHWEASRQFERFVKDLPGEVLVLHHAFVSAPAGKQPFFHSVNYADPTAWALPPRTEADASKREMTLEIWRTASREQSVPWIILDSRPENWYPNYVIVTDISAEYQAMVPLTGVPSRPQYLLAPNPLVKGGAAPLTDPQYQRLFREDWQTVSESARLLEGQQGIMDVLLETGPDYWVEISMQAPCPAGERQARWITVLWNEAALGDIIIPACGTARAGFPIAASSLQRQGNQLIFRQPLEADFANESSIGITSIYFDQQP
jgi:hypothetical protein